MRRMERRRGEKEGQDPRTLQEIVRIATRVAVALNKPTKSFGRPRAIGSASQDDCKNPIVRCLEELPRLTSQKPVSGQSTNVIVSVATRAFPVTNQTHSK
jgi:hypothetical protein